MDAVIGEKVLAYETFLNEKLRGDLKRKEAERTIHCSLHCSSYFKNRQRPANINNKLRKITVNGLKKLLEQRDEIYSKTADYLQLRNTLERIMESGLDKSNLKAQVDLGCNFYAQAIVHDPSKVLVKIGLDYYLEFTLADAMPFISRKIKHFEAITEKLSKDIVNVQANMKMVLQGLRELQMISYLPDERKCEP